MYFAVVLSYVNKLHKVKKKIESIFQDLVFLYLYIFHELHLVYLFIFFSIKITTKKPFLNAIRY